MNIVLIGYRCAGKSELGCKLASHLQMRFVDTDHLIEESYGERISHIVESCGWDHFRALEKGVISEISNLDHQVIATGGGVVLDPENVMALRKRGLIIWLKADPQTLLKRMEMDTRNSLQRPPLTGQGTLGEIEEVLALRNPRYEKASTIQLDTSNLNVEMVLEALISILEQQGGI
ncbi:MAG: shikimate kinase [Thermodesulfobacteriota bacterium]|nr:shikimate kinase [Thermodesulfobacteriota bacterium]